MGNKKNLTAVKFDSACNSKQCGEKTVQIRPQAWEIWGLEASTLVLWRVVRIVHAQWTFKLSYLPRFSSDFDRSFRFGNGVVSCIISWSLRSSLGFSLLEDVYVPISYRTGPGHEITSHIVLCYYRKWLEVEKSLCAKSVWRISPIGAIKGCNYVI